MIDNELETRLRRVLAEDAARAPRPVEAPALRPVVNGHPVTGARRRSVAGWFAVAAAVTSVGVGIAVVGLPGSSPAFADWRSHPQAADPATAAALSRACRHRGGVEGLPVKAVDLRGDGAYLVLSGAGRWVDCLATRRHSEPGGWTNDPNWLVFNAMPARPAPGPLAILSAKVPEAGARRFQKVTWVSGRVAATVARVRVQTSRGRIDATVTGGLFAAWWPGNDADSAVVRAYDRAGALVAQADQLTCADAKGQLSARIRVPGHPDTGGCRATG